MRVGRNPNNHERAQGLHPIVLAVVTHLPNLVGYHEKRMEVIQTCLSTMRRNADMMHSMIVWDNGSVPALREWIRQEIKPDLLIESVNIGKSAAKAHIARMLRPEMIMAFSDDDILFMPGWLKPQIDLLQHYPNVSVVSGYPLRTSFRWGCENTIRWARKNGELEVGRFLPFEWERDFALSIGRPVDFHMETSKDDNDYRVTYKGKRALCTAHHCQFVGYAGRIAQAARFDGYAMGDEKPFDATLDALGLRLSTTQRLARHIGNVLDEGIRKDIC